MTSLMYTFSIFICCIIGIKASPSIIDFPYFAAIEENGNHVCSATIVDDLYVMSTNSCVGALDVKKMRVRVGTDRLGIRGAVFKVLYSIPSSLGDVAMVRVASALPFSLRIRPVNPNNINIQEGQPGVLVGWENSKKTRSPLLPSPVVVLPSANCSAAYSGIIEITSNMFCLSPSEKDSHPCLADLGAPLYYNEQYFGLVTHTPGCSHTNLPVVVTAVSPFTPFLIGVLCDFNFFH